MSAARTASLAISLLVMVIMAAFMGCSPDRNGTAASNSPPQVHIVNTPPDSAQFSRNPELNWYATDIDGYIDLFRYAVLVDTQLVINGEQKTPLEFIEEASDEDFGWTILDVDLDNPQSTATIRLFADVEDPVESFVTQYFFVQAQDDMGARSNIDYRMYSRNNNYPNTHFRSQTVYINAKSPDSPQSGISLEWGGADSTDWGRAEPPLEYEWRLYGPFLDTATIYIDLAQENCIYDPVADSFVNCIDIPVFDYDNLPPAVGGASQPLLHSQGPNYAADPNDVWVTETDVTLYDVFQGLNLTETSRYKFIFWVRARDDGFVPDPTPSFSQFYVYEAKFEKPVMVIDETGYTTRVGRWAAKSMDTAKAYFLHAIHDAGYTEFDTTSGVDYFFSANKKDREGTSITPRLPEFLDVLSHRVMIYYQDDVESGPNETPFGLMPDVFFGIDMGANAWILSRNLGDVNQSATRGEFVEKSINFQERFGIAVVQVEAWLNGAFNFQNQTFNEEFIGAFPNIEGYPYLALDYGPGSLMEQRYPMDFLGSDHEFLSSPEIGVGERTLLAAPLYLYISRDGDKSIFHGKVNSVLLQNGDTRTACFMFTPLAMDAEPMQQVFNTVIPWLSEKFESPSGSGGAAKMQIPSYNTSFMSLSERRERIDRFLRYLDEYAEPSQVQRYIGEMKPVELSPSSAIE